MIFTGRPTASCCAVARASEREASSAETLRIWRGGGGDGGGEGGGGAGGGEGGGEGLGEGKAGGGEGSGNTMKLVMNGCATVFDQVQLVL